MVFEILKRKDEEEPGRCCPCSFKQDKTHLLVLGLKRHVSNCNWVSSAAGEKEGGDLPAEEKTAEFNKDAVTTPKPVRALICGEKGEASVVKYKITATPGYVCIGFTDASIFTSKNALVSIQSESSCQRLQALNFSD